MTKQSIEERIREHYTAHNGEWLVEKGKVKEAKLLKEACETIEKLRRQCAESERLYWSILKSTEEKKRELEKREKAIEERERRFEDRIANLSKDLKQWM